MIKIRGISLPAVFLALHLGGEVLAWVGPVFSVPAVVALQAAARGLGVGRGGLHLGVVTHHLQHRVVSEFTLYTIKHGLHVWFSIASLQLYRVITDADCPVVALVVPAVLTLVIAPK